MAYNMSTGDSAIKLTAQQEAEVAQMNSVSEIQEAMRRFALEQRLVEPDPFDHSILHEVERPNIPTNTPHVRVLEVNGKKITLQADSEDALTKLELAKMREIFGAQPAAVQEEQPRDESGRFAVRTDDPAAAALAPSVIAALQAAGIDPQALMDVSDARRNAQTIEKGWAAATEEFRNSAEGSTWVGGVANRNILGEYLVELGLSNSPSAENLSKAYEYMKERGLVVPN